MHALRQIMPTSLFALSLIAQLPGCRTPVCEKKVVVEPNVDVRSYRNATIYKSAQVDFSEQSLAAIFREHGFTVLGEKEAARLPEGSVLGVRYSVDDGHPTCLIYIQCEDFHSGRTIFTVGGRGEGRLGIAGVRADCEAARKQVLDAMREALEMDTTSHAPQKPVEARSDDETPVPSV
jgi:hypothetical protein